MRRGQGPQRQNEELKIKEGSIIATAKMRHLETF